MSSFIERASTVNITGLGKWPTRSTARFIPHVFSFWEVDVNASYLKRQHLDIFGSLGLWSNSISPSNEGSLKSKSHFNWDRTQYQIRLIRFTLFIF